jgi:hypothetical protein
MALYSLKLDCNFNSDDGNFQKQEWSKDGNLLGDVDKLDVSIGDQVQFSVQENSGASIEKLEIFVTFGRRRGAGNLAKVGAPFQLAGNRARCVLSGGVQQSGELLIGPFPIQLNTQGSKKQHWKFGFTAVARVTGAGGVIKEFGYDPEMDVDIP